MNRGCSWVRRCFGLVAPLLLVLAASSLLCQDKAEAAGIELASSPNPVGSGARAHGMGGAFIAVADDATAASWNPGGLIQLETPEISVVGAGLYRVEDNTFGKNPEASGRQYASRASLNFLSATYPFELFDRDMVVSLSYQHLYNFTRDWKVNLFDKVTKINTDWRVAQDGGLYAYGLAYCIQLHSRFSLGFTLNFWQNGIYQNGWERIVTEIPKTAKGTLKSFQVKDRYTFTGFNGNIGVLWDVVDKLSLGAVFKAPFRGDLTHEYSQTYQYKDHSDYSTSTSYEHLDMPMSCGLGLAYRPWDELTLSADIYRTRWQSFVLIDANGKKTSQVTGLSPSKSDVSPTTQVRLGSEYLISKAHFTVPLRAGVFYDPSPAKGEINDYFGFSLGTGIGVGRFVFDLAYQYRFGRDVEKSLVQQTMFSQDVNEHTFYSSLIVHF